MNLLYWPSDFSDSGGAEMKSKYWAILLFCLVAVCIGLSLLFMSGSSPSAQAQITSGGILVATVNLDEDQEFTVESPDGCSNTITVKDGAIAVTAADCPDHYCMDRGFCTGGTQIVCLPNRLVITFLGESEVDFVAG